MMNSVAYTDRDETTRDANFANPGDGEIWKKHRVTTRPFFARERIVDFEHFEKFTQKSLDVLSQFGPSQPVDVQDLFARFTTCPNLKALKLGVGFLARGFPSHEAMLKLNGASLIKLGKNCPKLEDLNVFVSDPSAIEASNVSSEHFDAFCKSYLNAILETT